MHSLSTPPSSTLQQFLTSVLSLRGPDSLPYSEDVKYLIRQHLLSLSQSHPSLRPTTDTFTHNDGRSVNLLQSDGTLPMTYQNDTYNIPIIIWLMETYPRHPPLVYVNPTRDMVIKHQHLFVNPSGMVLIPYLQNWVFPSSNLVDLGRNLISCFIDLGRSNPNPSSNLNANAFGSGSFEDQAKHRKLRSILNKLTLENFEKLFDQVKQVNIDNAYTLSGLVGQIFDRVLMEPTFVEMYANFCSRLSVELPGFGEDNEKITFKRLLLNKCQEEFERGERAEEEGEIKQSEEERVKARRRKLGNIRLIGELFKKRMLTERIMHECIKKLLGFNQNTTPDEENIEALCKLMSTIGEKIDHVKAKKDMDAYFDMMFKLSNNTTLSSRVRFMLKDAIDLRKSKWQQRRKVKGPKKIDEVHRDAQQQRQAHSSRLARGPNSNRSLRRGGQPMDFGPRGSQGVLLSNPLSGGYRVLPQWQNHDYTSPIVLYLNTIASGSVRPAIPPRSSPLSLQWMGSGSGSFEDQAKQRKMKSILNKLTPQNFEKLFEQVKQVNIDNVDTMSGVIGQIFDKALMEPSFVEMYANFCSRLSVHLPDFVEDDKMITFKKLLINKCQVEFERGEREEENGEIKQSEEEQEEKRRRKLVNIRLIGELYKKRMLTERIMHEGIKKLLGFNQNTTPDEENIEVLCKLMSIIGEMIDHVKAKKYMDEYFDMMFKLSNNTNLSSRVRFMLKDAIDLRKNKWQQRRKVEGPKKIEGIRRDVHQERQAQSSRLARGPNSNSSLRRGGQPMDFGPRGSASVLPSNPQIGGGYRGLPQQNRGFGNQDSIFDLFENRILSVPVRPTGDETITLGPQGGLARGMAVRGQPSMQGVAGPNNGYGSRDDMVSRNMPERPSPRPVYDRVPPSQPDHTWVSTLPQSGSSDKPAVSEDRLHEMSIEAIKEFYSARDEKEVALCIKDLNAPGFYPTMISIWVTDSFERKDMDRDSLAKLLINLTKSQENIITQESLVRGFESVLSTLEDALNNAPKAAEFLGRMFARLLTEDVIPFKQVSRIIHKGGEEEGQLVEAGLAAEVLGVILEIIKSEKGDPFLNDLCASSDIRLESFRPSTLKKTSRLDKFI